MSNPTLDLKKTLKKIEKSIKEAVNKKALKPVAEFTLKLVVKRTRLGYAVFKTFGERAPLVPLSDGYVEQRKLMKLDSTTRPKKSNLTLTGQMLRSMEYKVEDGGIIIFPSRQARTGSSLSNYELAEIHAKGNKNLPRRVFNRLSSKEYNQVLRFYRKTFGDLLRLRKLIK